MGLILAPDSPASSLAFIPGLVPPLAAAGYELAIVTIPTDPAAARERMRQLLDEGVAGLCCCPSVYAAALEAAGRSKPIIDRSKCLRLQEFNAGLSTSISGTPGKVRTCDRRIRNPMLYPAELRG